MGTAWAGVAAGATPSEGQARVAEGLVSGFGVNGGGAGLRWAGGGAVGSAQARGGHRHGMWAGVAAGATPSEGHARGGRREGRGEGLV